MSAIYTYFTHEVISEFEGNGSESVIEVLDSVSFSEAGSDSVEESETIVATIFTELLLSFEDDKLSLDPIMQFLFSSIKNDNVARIFCQVLSVFPATEKILNLLQLLCRKQNIIKPEAIVSYISTDLLKELDVVPKAVLTKTLNGRIRDEFYTQKKYNLLHEEIDGYSKFIVEIYNIFRFDETEFQVDSALQIIEKLIGHFSLDPNRCLDILLEIIESSFVCNCEMAIRLLRKSRWWPTKESDNSSIETLSYGGSEPGAKVLGLKLLKSPSDKDLPETFKIMVSCLIKEGFISFGDIYQYLRPSDEDMEVLEKEYKKKLEDDVAKAGANALALAAPLADDEDEGKKKEKTISKNVPEPLSFEKKLQLNFKYQFLRVLLGNGLYWPSIFILTKYPFLANVDQDIPELLNRLFNAMISPLFNQISPFTKDELSSLQTSGKLAFSRPHNIVEYDDFPCQSLYTFKTNIKSYSQKKFIYFYSSWSNGLPTIDSVFELFRVSKEFLKFIGVNLSHDIELFTKICEIGIWDLKNNPEDSNRKEEWFHYFRNFIFPAMAVIEENSIAIDKAFALLSFYPLEDRFSVYGELYQVLAKNNPLVKMAYGKAEKATKAVLKRLSKENVRPMMRRLAKISFSNPLPCFLTILQQIESYDNLNTLVVETARYFNKYGWDNLTAAILMRLTLAGRSSTQDNGMAERQWLQSLASFIGKICQRYPQEVDLHTIINFLLKSFYVGESIGLIVLKEIFIAMGGIQTITNLTLQQIDLINCGSSLEKLVFRTINDLRYERQKSGSYLVKAFIDLDAINELLAVLCNLSNDLESTFNETHLKVLTSRIDDVKAVIRLFITLVNFFGSKEDLEKSFMSIAELTDTYNVPLQWSFELWRPLLAANVSTAMIDDNSTWSPALRDVITYIPDLIPKESTEVLSAGFVSTFWQLALYDLNYSADLYTNETVKIESNIRSLKEWISINLRDKDVAKATIEKARKDLKQNEEFLKLIPLERDIHSEHNNSVIARLNKESSHWFLKNGKESVRLQMQTFLQLCILPRAVQSSFDAVFAARLIFKLHDFQTPKFYLIILLDELIKSRVLFATLFTSTPTEAENLGLFFADILRTLNTWRNEAVFDKIVSNSSILDETDEALSFNDFRTRLYEFHEIILKDIASALEVTEYMSRRNGITFLKNLLGVYPNIEDQCEKIVALIDNIAHKETREDLILSSRALVGHMKSRTQEWVHLWDFLPMEDEEKEAHVKERKHIEDERLKEKKRLEEEKRKKKEAERKKEDEKRKEEQKALEQAAREEEIKKQLNYDSQKSSTPRPNTRGTSSSSRGRYDNYANAGPSTADTKWKNEATNKSQRGRQTPVGPKGNEPEQKYEIKENKSNISQPKDVPSHPASVLNHQTDRSDKNHDRRETTPSKILNLKARLSLAKKELQESRGDITENSKESTPRAPTPRESNKAPTRESNKAPVPHQNTSSNDRSVSNRHKEDSRPARAPLPTQSSVAALRDRGYNKEQFSQGRFANSKNTNRPSQGATNRGNQDSKNTNGEGKTLPPPPPPPPISIKGKDEGRAQKSSDTSNARDRNRIRSEEQRGGRYDDRSQGRYDDTRSGGRFEEKQSRNRSDDSGRDSGRGGRDRIDGTNSTVPPPPPPPPRKSRGDRFEEGRSGRYDNKRKSETSYNRGYEKRSRY